MLITCPIIPFEFSFSMHDFTNNFVTLNMHASANHADFRWDSHIKHHGMYMLSCNGIAKVHEIFLVMPQNIIGVSYK